MEIDSSDMSHLSFSDGSDNDNLSTRTESSLSTSRGVYSSWF